MGEKPRQTAKFIILHLNPGSLFSLTYLNLIQKKYSIGY